MALSPKKRRLAQGNDLNGILFEPESTWVAPTEFPRLDFLRSLRRIGFDSEVRDPELEDKGPGSFRRDGYPVGFSLAGIDDTGKEHSWYFPTRHLSGGNLDEGRVIEFLGDVMGDPHTEKVGANSVYDLEWLQFVGITTRGRIHDVQSAEALINEESEDGYALGKLSHKYLGISKREELLRRAASEFNINPKRDLWKLHAKYVGPYGEADALIPLKILLQQEKEMAAQKLEGIYALECDIIPIVHRMRQQGVRVDVERAEKLHAKWNSIRDKIQYDILVKYGTHLDPWSGPDIAKLCDRLQIQYPRTEAGRPSFEQHFLDSSSHDLFKQLRQLRRYDSLGSRFIKGLILDNQINGRIHCQFNPLRGDENGVRGGRFSSTGPNLQQVPARDPDLAPLIRGLFIPEEGCDWAKLDYSQQEPRITVHYAVLCNLPGARDAAEVWIRNPSEDFYKFVAEAASVVRKDAKTIYLGRSYGMGKKKLATDLGRTEEAAQEILDVFDAKNPYVKQLADKCMKQVEKQGYIRTLAGRVCHFDWWVPVDSKWGSGEMPIQTREKAETHYPNRRLKRAFTHKSLNRLIQGSAGDMTKLSMVYNFKNVPCGYGRWEGAIPHLTVHDENDYSAPNMEYALRLKHGMENCVTLKVPIVAELDYGKTWK